MYTLKLLFVDVLSIIIGHYPPDDGVVGGHYDYSGKEDTYENDEPKVKAFSNPLYSNDDY